MKICFYSVTTIDNQPTKHARFTVTLFIVVGYSVIVVTCSNNYEL